jgi:hypothetical protein
MALKPGDRHENTVFVVGRMCVVAGIIANHRVLA